MSDNEMSEEELRALLKPRRAPPQRRVTGHWCIFTEKDCRAFTLALREKIPDVVFLFRKEEAAGDGHSAYFEVDGLEECANQRYQSANATVFVPKTAQDVKRLRSEPIPMKINLITPFYFNLILETEVYPRTRPDGTAYYSRWLTNMYGNYYPSDRDTANFLRRMWRVAGKITHNRWDVVDDETGKHIIRKNELGRWCGYDALRWCQESPVRVLEGRYRTSADWSMPDSPYYD